MHGLPNILLAGALALTAATGCRPTSSGDASRQGDEALVQQGPQFSADSALAHVKAQVQMGPRVPGTKGHEACEQYIVDQVKAAGADTVISHRGKLTAFNGDELPMHNILARYRTGAPRRILLMAHYDTRPWSDQDADSLKSRPVPGANDGASGVAVLLELSRHLAQLNDSLGVDLLFTDVEDYGNSEGEDEDIPSWAMGTQQWVKQWPYTPDRLPLYGICVDMVGGQDAKFYREMYSDQFAQGVNDRVWAAAAKAGFGDRFINEPGGYIVDDHTFVTRAGIPSIDIIEMRNPQTGSFPPNWHTTRDDVDFIDPESMRAVGQTLLQLIAGEK